MPSNGFYLSKRSPFRRLQYEKVYLGMDLTQGFHDLMLGTNVNESEFKMSNKI